MSKNIKKPKPEDHAKKTLKDKEDRQKIFEETFDDLTNNPKYKEFFEQYHPDSVKGFIKEYATKKWMWMQHGHHFVKKEVKRAVQFREEAEGYLLLINQKKLFNLQCLWRAGKITLEGVECCQDFWTWEKDTKRCPFLPAITREEFAVLKKAILADHQFDMGPTVKEGDFFSQAWFHWQQYDVYKKYYNEHGENPFPDWYKYYDMYFGTADLFLLEDIKGPKEYRYMMIGHDSMHPDQKVLENHPEIEFPDKPTGMEFKSNADTKTVAGSIPDLVAVTDSNVQAVKLHRMNSDDDEIMNFMEEFEEDRQLVEYGYLVTDNLRDHIQQDFEPEHYIDFLMHIDELVPMKANWNWGEALQDTMNEYKYRKELEVLDDVFEEYLLRKENNIPLDVNDKYITYANMEKEFSGWYKAKVLLGRKLCGEPEDFNY